MDDKFPRQCPVSIYLNGTTSWVDAIQNRTFMMARKPLCFREFNHC